MMKRLFWKELRENRMIPIWVAILLGLMMAAVRMMADLNSDITVWYLYVSWSLAGVFTAAGAISREVGSGTLTFLLAQPVSRRAIWWVKWLSGLGILAASVVCTSGVWALVQRLLYEPYTWSVQTRLNLSGWAMWALLASAACYAIAWSLSALLDRAISAAMLTLVIAGAIMIPVTMIADFYTAVPGNQIANIILLGFACQPAFACASYAAFTRGEAMRSRRRLLWAAAGWMAGLVATAVIFLVLCSFANRFRSRGAIVGNWALSDNGHYLLVRAMNDGPAEFEEGRSDWARGDHSDYRVERLVVESVTGPAFQRVLPSGRPDAWSPDGRYLLYERDGAPFGLIHTQSTPVCVDTRTGLEFRLDLPPSPFGGPPEIADAAWSPDGRWLAIQTPSAISASPTHDSSVIGDILFFRCADIPSHGGLWRLWSSTALRSTATYSRIEPSSCYLIGGPEHGLNRGWSWQNIAWSGDSRWLYFLDGRAFSAVIPPTSAGAGARIYHLFLIPARSRGLALMRSRGDRRVLLTYPTGSGSAGWNPSDAFDRRHDSAVIDLADAMAAALAHPSLPIPSLKNWARRWSIAAIPPAWRTSQLTISPDGRFLMQWRWMPRKPKDRRRYFASVLDLNAPDHPSWHIPDQDLPDPDDWLSDGLRCLDYDGVTGRENVVVHVLTGERDTVPLRGSTILRTLPGNRLLLADRHSLDVLHIKFDVVKM